MNLWIVAGSLAAVLALAGIAWMLRLGIPQRIGTGNDAIALAEALTSGFEGRAAIVSIDGGRAIVAGANGALVLIEPKGARNRARRIDGATVEWSPRDDVLTIRLSPMESVHIAVPAAADGAVENVLAVLDR